MKRAAVAGMVLLVVITASLLKMCVSGHGYSKIAGSVVVVNDTSAQGFAVIGNGLAPMVSIANTADQEDIRQPQSADPPKIFDR